MNTPAHAALAAHVAAWHNRQPLARRITADHVTGFGIVALPFVAGQAAQAPAPGADGEDTLPMAGATLRERAAARAQAAAPADQAAPGNADDAARPAAADPAAPESAGLLARLRARLRQGPGAPAPRAVFSEDFIAPLAPAAVRRFAARHAVATVPGAAGWPQRDVAADPALLGRGEMAAATHPVTLYLRTAAIEVDDKRCRVLIGAGDKPSVLGRRTWSLPRSAAASSALALVLVAAAALPHLGLPADADDALALAAGPAEPAPAAAGAAASSPAEPRAEVAQRAATAGAANSAETAKIDGLAVAAPTAEAASLPPVAAAASGSETPAAGPAGAASADAAAVAVQPRDEFPAISIRPNLREAVGEATLPRARITQRAAEAASAAAPGPTVAASTAPTDPTTPLAASQAAELPAPGTVFALAGKPARARAAAELRLALLEDAVADVRRSDEQRTELLQVGPLWRAVWWPFASRDAAEEARAHLAARGVKVELVAF